MAIAIYMWLCLGAALVIFIYGITRNNKMNKNNKEFINSIKIGDVFETTFNERVNEYTNPFDTIEEYKCIISDVKISKSGYKWVEYYNPKFGEDAIRFTDRADKFIKFRKRIKEGLETQKEKV